APTLGELRLQGVDPVEELLRAQIGHQFAKDPVGVTELGPVPQELFQLRPRLRAQLERQRAAALQPPRTDEFLEELAVDRGGDQLGGERLGHRRYPALVAQHEEEELPLLGPILGGLAPLVGEVPARAPVEPLPWPRPPDVPSTTLMTTRRRPRPPLLLLGSQLRLECLPP